ncbi:unnamed protein product [Paramecium sonneborni]|uniref:Uncharacterized protein n=1 Tax=Paramecium sonneborni TaxID=65129 RepID=A0A8S1P361_9CILI|nr:unnamed protein product [Paramecium sonneborni]
MEFNMMYSRIPTLKQAESSFQRYRNPLNEFHNKSESNSFEHKQSEFPIPINQYMFIASTPIYPILGEQKYEMIDQSNFFHKNNNQVELNNIDKEAEYKLNITTFGCKKLCQIDCLLVERYFNKKYQVQKTFYKIQDISFNIFLHSFLQLFKIQQLNSKSLTIISFGILNKFFLHLKDKFTLQIINKLFSNCIQKCQLKLQT